MMLKIDFVSEKRELLLAIPPVLIDDLNTPVIDILKLKKLQLIEKVIYIILYLMLLTKIMYHVMILIDTMM